MNQSEFDSRANSQLPSEAQWLVDELSEEAQRKMDWVSKIRGAHSAFNKKLERQLVQEAAKDLECHPRTIQRMVGDVEEMGLSRYCERRDQTRGNAATSQNPGAN